MSTYKTQLRNLQIELVKLQHYIIETGMKVLLIFEGRDAAGKDGTIKRIVEHTSPRDTRVVALGKPSERDTQSWYFQRFVPHLPVAGELVLFNRSWYNRAGVERVMGFCTQAQYSAFLRDVNAFEELLIDDGMTIHKIYLDISREEQTQRLAARKRDPLSQWKISPIDEQALALWTPYCDARDDMLLNTHTSHAPWTIAHADDKKACRLAVLAHLLAGLDYPNKNPAQIIENPDVIVPFSGEVAQKLAR